MGTIKKYLPFIAIAAVVLYFRNEILGMLPSSVRGIFKA
jgi:hypothetical protein